MSDADAPTGPTPPLLETVAAAVASAVFLAWVLWHLGGLAFLADAPVPGGALLMGSPLGPWPTVLALVLLPATLVVLRRPGGGTAGLLMLASAVLVAASYPLANLDWGLLLRDFGIARGGVPDLGTLALAASPLVLAVAYHLATLRRSARRWFAAKGASEDEVRAAAETIVRTGAAALGVAVLVAVVLTVALVVAPPGLVPDAGPLVGPLLAAAGVVAAVAWVLRARDDAAVVVVDADEG